MVNTKNKARAMEINSLECLMDLIEVVKGSPQEEVMWDKDFNHEDILEVKEILEGKDWWKAFDNIKDATAKIRCGHNFEKELTLIRNDIRG